MLFGALEAGGTKFVCAVGDEFGNIKERVSIPTSDPSGTMEKVFDFFDAYQLEAIGIGTFGPADVDPGSPTYGMITTTPKLKWKNYPMLNVLKERYGVPMGFTTDVNAAALAEAETGAAAGLDGCLYITIGTGIGAGAVLQGRFLQGLSHPEMGHILIRRHEKDIFEGTCPFHKDCLEGLAAGPAIEARWGNKGPDLQDRDDVWEMEGWYIAQALMQYILILSPQKIILGGGVMKQVQLFPIIARHLKDMLNGYVQLPELEDGSMDYITGPKHGDDAGIIGALLLAERAFKQAESNH